MKIFICANLYKEKTAAIFPDVVKTLKLYGMLPLVESRFYDVCKEMKIKGVRFGNVEDNAANCNIFLTIGGDGTILRWGKKAAVHKKPIIGVTTGRLGFMATLEKDSLSKLSALSEKKYKLSARMMLDVIITAGSEQKKYVALNDIVLFKGTTSKLPEYIVFSGNTEVTRVGSEVLIIFL